MIRAETLFKSYQGGRVPVLKGISCEIPKGKFAVILGASGSGKSTLLSILSGLEKADSGKVFYEDKELGSLNEKELTKFHREKVGFVFQQYYLLPHLNVENNVKLGANLIGNRNFAEMIERVGLKELTKRRPYELSGGEQQRVCIARALSKNPEILFCDEPTGALDEATGRAVLDTILSLQKERQFTMIMVTHNKNIAELSDMVLTMKSGEISSVCENIGQKTAYTIGW